MNAVPNHNTFAPLIQKVAVQLLGQPNKHLSNKTTLRWGTHGSLKIDLPDGVWHDKEANQGGGVVELVVRERGGDKAAAIAWLEEQGYIEKLKRQFYDYCDESGAVLFKVERLVRAGVKTFRQHGPDGHGDFVCKKGCMDGIRRVPYRLPDLLRADPAEPVFVCEGEKDADRLANAGLIATTNPQGAGKFEADFARYFTGRRVIVLEDNDEAGRNHAVDVQRKLADAAEAVSVLQLPNLPEKGDVSDWLNAGGTIAQLRELAASAIEHPAQAETAKQRTFSRGFTAASLMAMQFDPIRYVVNGYVAEGLTLLAGAPKIGKSWMALGIGIAIASGRPAFGSIPCTQGDVLYLALEDNQRRLKSRLLKMGITNPPERLTFDTAWPTLDDGALDLIEDWILSVERPTLVMVDVLTKVRPSTKNNESSYEADYRTLTGLQELAGRYGIAVMALHHTRKMEADDPFDSVSGTRGLTGAADTVLVLKRDIGTGRTVLYGRGRDIEEIETAFEFDRDSANWRVLGAASEFAKTDERQAIRNVLEGTDNPMNAREISDILGKPYDNIRKTLTRMAHAGEVEKQGRGLYACPKCPNVPKHPDIPPDWDFGTDGTGACTFPDDDGEWIGEAPAETAARVKYGRR